MQEEPSEEAQTQLDQTSERTEDKTVAAVASWLAARWLPAPVWMPDPAWLETEEELPDPPMTPQSFGVISSLLLTQQACEADLAVDPTQPDQIAKLARIVATLNRRMPDLQQVAADQTPWAEVAALNDQADAVLAAATQGLFENQEEQAAADQPLAPWRPLLTKVKALAPLIAIFRMLDADPTEPAAVDKLADRVRTLRAVTLPPIEQPLAVFQLINRYNAIARLESSLGADPRKVPFARVQKAVQRKVDSALEQLPQTVQLTQGQLAGVVARQPNPSQLLSPVPIAHAQALKPEVLDRMQWQVPPPDQLDLLTTAAPLAKLVTLMRALGASPVRTTPCNQACDAAAAGREAQAAGS